MHLCVTLFPWLPNGNRQSCLPWGRWSPLPQVDSSSHLGLPRCRRQRVVFFPNFILKQVQGNSKQQGWVKKIRSLLFSMYSLNRVRKYCCFHFITLYFGGITFFFFFLTKSGELLSQEAVRSCISWTDGRLRHITKGLL